MSRPVISFNKMEGDKLEAFLDYTEFKASLGNLLKMY